MKKDPDFREKFGTKAAKDNWDKTNETSLWEYGGYLLGAIALFLIFIGFSLY